MKLLNFELERSVGSIVLRGLGVEWDLHNFADFGGLTFDPSSDSALLKWTVRDVANPWGSKQNTARACGLLFRTVTYLHMEGGDSADPTRNNDTTLAGVSKGIPREPKYRFKNVWDEGEPFHLVFQFINGRDIEIGSETVEVDR